MNSRRTFLVSLGAVGLWGPLSALGQQTGLIPVVGILSLEIEDQITMFREGLRKLGYVEGRNIRLELRNPGDRYERLAEIASEFVRLKANVIVSMGSTATLTAKKATSTIPIVMVAGVDPVKEKLAISLARPGENVTGVSTILQELSPKRLELAKEAAPGLRRVGILWNPDSRTSTLALADTREAAKTLSLQLQMVEARSADDFDKAFETLARNHVTVFVLVNSSAFVANRKQLLDSAARHRVAGVYPASEWVETGALLSYGQSRSESYERAASYVDKILKGAKPGDIPIEQPIRFELIVSMKTAKAFGIKVPNSILVRADKIIER